MAKEQENTLLETDSISLTLFAVSDFADVAPKGRVKERERERENEVHESMRATGWAQCLNERKQNSKEQKEKAEDESVQQVNGQLQCRSAVDCATSIVRTYVRPKEKEKEKTTSAARLNEAVARRCCHTVAVAEVAPAALCPLKELKLLLLLLLSLSSQTDQLQLTHSG